MDFRLTVGKQHVPYLVLQNGQLDHLKGNHTAWLGAYHDHLAMLFENVRPHLPHGVNTLLDVGSGLGGIDVLINRFYGGVGVWLLDGRSDKAHVERHAKTFNDMSVALSFHSANGVRCLQCMDPDNLEARFFDLVVSFRSWCFHYPPSFYLDYVLSCCHETTTLILDVRNERPEWLEQLQAAFGDGQVIFENQKLSRRVFKRDLVPTGL